jgi:hypothetical protein
MKFGNIIQVETLRYLVKITTLRDRDVLAAKHTALLQLLYIASGNQARLDARSEFKISQRSLKRGGKAGRKYQ